MEAFYTQNNTKLSMLNFWIFFICVFGVQNSIKAIDIVSHEPQKNLQSEKTIPNQAIPPKQEAEEPLSKQPEKINPNPVTEELNELNCWLNEFKESSRQTEVAKETIPNLETKEAFEQNPWLNEFKELNQQAETVSSVAIEESIIERHKDKIIKVLLLLIAIYHFQKIESFLASIPEQTILESLLQIDKTKLKQREDVSVTTPKKNPQTEESKVAEKKLVTISYKKLCNLWHDLQEAIFKTLQPYHNYYCSSKNDSYNRQNYLNFYCTCFDKQDSAYKNIYNRLDKALIQSSLNIDLRQKLHESQKLGQADIEIDATELIKKLEDLKQPIDNSMQILPQDQATNLSNNLPPLLQWHKDTLSFLNNLPNDNHE